MSTRCFPLVRGRVMRATRLDSCGRPAYGNCATVTSSGFVSIATTANINDGEAIVVTNANGEDCINEPARPSLDNYGVEITFCGVDPDMVSVTTGQLTVPDAQSGDIVGFRVNRGIKPGDIRWALEVWTDVPGVACGEDAAGGSFGYVLYPHMQGGLPGDMTIENAAVSFVITGAITRDAGGWGVGPYNVVSDIGGDPGPLVTPIGDQDHLHVQMTTVAPPEDDCGCRPLDDPDNPPALTGVAGLPGVWEDAEGNPGAVRPYAFDDLDDIEAAPETAWTSGQYVILGDGSYVHWSATAWVEGKVS